MTQRPTFYEGQVVLVRPLPSEQGESGATPARIVKMNYHRVQAEWLSPDELKRLVVHEMTEQTARRRLWWQRWLGIFGG